MLLSTKKDPHELFADSNIPLGENFDTALCFHCPLASTGLDHDYPLSGGT